MVVKRSLRREEGESSPSSMAGINSMHREWVLVVGYVIVLLVVHVVVPIAAASVIGDDCFSEELLS